MNLRRLVFILFFIFVFVIQLGTSNQTGTVSKKPPKDEKQSLLAGRNVNMVSGLTLPDGDPYLQRQNEPSIAVSTRNPMHLLAGANDYRTIDMPFDDELPGVEKETALQPDAWLSVFKSFDGGQSWISTLLPGFPQDNSASASLSPLNGYEAAADPVVRAGTNGLFYYCGIAFNRDKKKSIVFVARFIDNNNMEGRDTIEHIDTRIVDVVDNGEYFIDKPAIAVGLPRVQGTTSIEGQTVHLNNVYVAYTAFYGSGDDLESEIRFARSIDNGATWVGLNQIDVENQDLREMKKKEKEGVNQGAVIAVDPRGNGTVYVAWRRFGDKNNSDGIFLTQSDDGGVNFSNPVAVDDKIKPFDQGTSSYSFRTNAYPALAADDQGEVYVAWSERKGKDESQIVLSTSEDKKKKEKWSKGKAIDDKGEGHQFMPSLIFAAGKLTMVWYDQRDDLAQEAKGKKAFSEYIEDSQVRHTIDVRIAQAVPDKNPDFGESERVTRYLHILDENGEVKQVQFSPPNFPLFRKGTAPFHGDYVDIATQMFVPSNGGWTFNSELSQSTVFHTTWTDNRDVLPPGGDWWVFPWPASAVYNAPNSDQTTLLCTDPLNTGMRNQNIYTARITSGILAGTLGNTKPVDDIQHTFIVFVKNATSEIKSFRLTINAPNASFRQASSLDTLDIEIPPYSTVTRTVFVDPPHTQIGIDVVEIDAPDGNEISGGITDYILLNSDPYNPPVFDPLSDPNNPEILYYEYHNPRVENPRVENYNLYTELNPRVLNPRVENPRVLNPRVLNPRVENPRVENPRVLNPRVENINFLNPEMENPRVENPRVENTAMADVIWEVGNDGNTTSAYTLTMLSNAVEYDAEGNPFLPDPDIIVQVLVYKMHTTPVADNCTLVEEHQDELLLNITNPRVENPRVWNPRVENPRVENPRVENPRVENASFALAPGEEAYVIFRIWDDNISGNTAGVLGTANVTAGGLSIEDIIGPIDPSSGVPEGVGAALSGHAANTEDVVEDIYDPPVSISENVAPEIGYSISPLEFEAPLNGSDDSLDLAIWNSGEGILDYTLSIEYTSGDSWLTLKGAEGIHTAGDLWFNHAVVTVHPAGLSADTYEADIVIEAPGASNSLLRVPVTLTITSAATAPTVTTNAASSVGTTGATLEGTVNANNSSTTVTFEYGTSTDYGTTVDADPSQVTGTANTPVSKAITGLASNTTYHYRVVAQSTAGTSYGGDLYFTTTIVVTAPTVTTDVVLVTTSTAAMSGGNVTSDGGASVTARGVCWSTSADPIIGTALGFTTDGTGTGEFDSSITGLTPGTTYHVRAYATNSVDTSYGSDVSFNTNTISGLVAYYPFNGNANDQSGNGNDGTVYGGATFTQDRFGNANGAINLDGTDDYVELPNETRFDLAELTIVAVFKVPDYSRRNYLISKGAEFGNYNLMINSSQDGNPGKAGYAHEILGGNWSSKVTNDPVPLDEFVHVAVTLDSQTFKSYLNGNPQVTAIPSSPLRNDENVTIGKAFFSGLGDQFFLGAIDEIRIYNRALSETEVEALYNQSSPGIITTVAGDGTAGFSGDGGPATSAQLDSPGCIAVDSAGNIFIADEDNHRIRRVDANTGVITTVAGNGSSGFGGDGGTATSASLYYPRGVALDSNDNLYIADTSNDRIRMVDATTGIITTVVELDDPSEIAFDAAGNMYINGYDFIKRKDAVTNDITIVAEDQGGYGYDSRPYPSGDEGGPAIQAGLYDPIGVALDSQGNLYFSSYYDCTILKVNLTTGIITTAVGILGNSWAGWGCGFGGDGEPAVITKVSGNGERLKESEGVIVDSAGNLYVADTGNHRIRRVDGVTGIITTIAGNGSSGYSGDGGAAISASLNFPGQMALDSQGNLYIVDTDNNRIRKVIKNW